jgi:16S rRNA (cytosine1402-N4)-methyltransferase
MPLSINKCIHLRNRGFGKVEIVRGNREWVHFDRMGNALRHVPVLETTVLHVLAPKSGESVLDCTLGLGGHSAAFLGAVGSEGTLTALDADTTNLEDARARLAPFGDRFRLVHANFRDAGTLGLGTFDVVFADLGLSSPHLDDPGRGFSFRTDGPLDLRYDQTSGRTAADLIERSSEDDLVAIIHDLGEVHQHVRPLAKLIAGTRVETTFAFKAKVEEVFRYRAPSVLPRLFQALRIAVNDELGALTSLLAVIPTLLNPGGRAGILSYHSLEDRFVKHAFKAWVEPEKDPLTGRAVAEPTFSLLTKKALVPDEEELASNPRSRSVKFRAILKLPA